MQNRPERRERRGVFRLVTLIVTVAVLCVGSHAAGYRFNLPTASVPIPAASASPDEVVRAYTKAYNSRDFRTTSALYPGSVPATWLDRRRVLGTMDDVRVVRSEPDTSSSYGSGAHWDVQVTLTMSGLQGSDLAYDNGPNGWTYYLDTSGPDRSWRIIDHGHG